MWWWCKRAILDGDPIDYLSSTRVGKRNDWNGRKRREAVQPIGATMQCTNCAIVCFHHLVWVLEISDSYVAVAVAVVIVQVVVLQLAMAVESSISTALAHDPRNQPVGWRSLRHFHLVRSGKIPVIHSLLNHSSIHPSIYPFIHPFIHSSIHLSIH